MYIYISVTVRYLVEDAKASRYRVIATIFFFALLPRSCQGNYGNLLKQVHLVQHLVEIKPTPHQCREPVGLQMPLRHLKSFAETDPNDVTVTKLGLRFGKQTNAIILIYIDADLFVTLRF